MVLASPLWLLLYGIPLASGQVIFLPLLLGGLLLITVMSTIGAVASHSKNSGMLSLLLALPLVVPVLIIGSASVPAMQRSVTSGMQHLAMMLGLWLVLLPICLYLGSMALKNAIEED